MKTTALRAAIIASLALAAAVPANAVAIAVVNSSFETLPGGGLPFTNCGTGCSYSYSADSPTSVPGWTASGGYGQFRPGTDASNFNYFNTLADGPNHAFTVAGSLQQTVTDTAVAGTTYTLTVAVGDRVDITGTGQVALFVGSNFVLATGNLVNGGWSDFVASYLATNADAGNPITIQLSSTSNQGNFDNVRLDATAAPGVPEPASWALLIAGFGLTGAALRRRRAAIAA